MNIAATTARLIEEARAMPDPHVAARLLRRRARVMEETPLSRWPEGVTAPDFLEAITDLRWEAHRLLARIF